QPFGPELFDLVGAARIVRQIVDRDRRARARENGRGRKADPRCRAGHDGGLAGQFVTNHLCLPKTKPLNAKAPSSTIANDASSAKALASWRFKFFSFPVPNLPAPVRSPRTRRPA